MNNAHAHEVDDTRVRQYILSKTTYAKTIRSPSQDLTSPPHKQIAVRPMATMYSNLSPGMNYSITNGVHRRSWNHRGQYLGCIGLGWMHRLPSLSLAAQWTIQCHFAVNNGVIGMIP